ncbi:hypothetical protein I553_10809 [Mycobacterium xenopi 4042]|uniref:Uncharacterized protein n=1 Tax=Mycobacterium xenopi 4042 TaxID=1299334 RepID=X8DA57_MYCXE|nr:hypothetical protein I553_10809 [Mycobacterium xenopi 4042]
MWRRGSRRPLGLGAIPLGAAGGGVEELFHVCAPFGHAAKPGHVHSVLRVHALSVSSG